MQQRHTMILAVAGVAVAAGLYFTQGRAPSPSPAPVPAAPAPVATQAPEATPKLDASAPPMPDAGVPFATAESALRTRALAGDGAAAWRWYREQADCRRWREWSAAPEGFARKLIDASGVATRDAPFYAMPPEEFAAFRNPSASTEVAAANAQNLMERLESLCQGLAAAPDDDIYRIAARAAESGPKAAKWNFIDNPPVDLSANEERRRDWARRATALAQKQLEAGDSEAAFALGVAYAKNTYDEGYAGAIRRDAFNGALEKDPVQAYELLSLYLRTQPAPARQERTQQLLAELTSLVSTPDREAATERAEKLRAQYFTGRDN